MNSMSALACLRQVTLPAIMLEGIRQHPRSEV